MSNQVCDEIAAMNEEMNRFKERCVGWRKMLDEGSYKLDAVVNIVNGLKTKEQEIKTSSKKGPVIQQISEEQINGFLEMLKTPAFQSLARQMLTKWACTNNK